MTRVIGALMSPILLIVLLILITMGVYFAPSTANEANALASLKTGFITGYQTMDLFAAFFFSALVFSQMQAALPNNVSEKSMIKLIILPSIIGSSILATIYCGLVYLGSHYSEMLATVNPELMLSTITFNIMGSYATWLMIIVMLFSCITTAVALNNIYARHLCKVLKLKDSKFPFMLGITTIISFTISLLDFKGIASFIAPLLELSYPGLIALTFLSIIAPDKRKLKSVVFWTLNFGMVMLSL